MKNHIRPQKNINREDAKTQRFLFSFLRALCVFAVRFGFSLSHQLEVIR